MFYGGLKEVARVFQEGLLQRKFSKFLSKFSGCFREVSRVYQEFFKVSSGRFPGNHGYYRPCRITQAVEMLNAHR